jgi:NAD(P)-dependent dehydrogenase (short-subunit alcohol dehydrogenase family)
MSDKVLEARPILERFRLDGRVALVTGGGRGIGRAYAHALGEAGAVVAILDIRPDLAGSVVAELQAKGIDALALEADVRREDQVQAALDSVLARWGKLTIGVNNAGVSLWQPAESMSLEQWNELLSVNLTGVFVCARIESQAMLAAGYGKIINTASMSGSIVNTPQCQAAYNASKAAVIHLTRSLAAEWAPRGVRVNSISPGYTRTLLVDDLLATPEGQQVMPRWMSLTPMGTMGEVTDLQGAAVFLAGEVSDFMTGADLIIDGGYCTW